MSIISIILLPIPTLIMSIIMIRSGTIIPDFIWDMIGITRGGTGRRGKDHGGAGVIIVWIIIHPGIAGIIPIIIIHGVAMIIIRIIRR